MSWYVRRGEREIGPLGEDALRALVGTGQVTRDTPLWREGLSSWTAAGALPGVLGPRAPAPSVPSPQAAIAVASDAAPPTAPPTPCAAVPELATPWRRYWARSADLMASSLLVAVLVAAIRPSLLAQLDAAPGPEVIAVLLLLPLALTMDALIFWALGNTPGKAIAGIKVLQERGARAVSAAAYLGRNLGVYLFGLGLGLPVISLLTLIYSYRRAAAGEVATWDRLCGSRTYALVTGGIRTWAAAGVYLVGGLVLFALGLDAQQNRARYTPAHPPAAILQQELAQAANSVNAASPRMIDQITRLDGAHAGPGSLFTYEYTLTTISVSLLSPTTLQTLRWRLSGHVRQAACTGTALKPMLRTGAIIRFDYRDRDGREITLVAISTADCGS
ncbi:MAG TPA: RDD family protein [Steroidobacteraceae bacterium]|nr:RDD family protein [Steroidobacteraceae bacterium]